MRAARALLGWSQRDLAKLAKIAISTVADFERGQRIPIPQNIQAIRDAITASGIALTVGGVVTSETRDSVAPGGQSGQPIRLIDATDLDHWSDRRDAQETAPELLSCLIRAEAGHAAKLRFPSGEGVQFRGWDGVCEIGTCTPYIPSGRSVWEISTQSKDPAKKAAQDLKKRTASTAADEQSQTTLVLVTTRRFPDKDRRAKEWAKAGQWSDVRVLDAEDLVQWIELHPAVGNWLAVLMAKRPEGALQLEDIWQEWARSTHPAMSADLIMAGRDEEAAKIHRWLRDPPAVLSLQGEATEEAIAFLYAAINQFPPEHRARHLVRTVVATSAAMARKLGDGPSPLILVFMDTEPGLAERLAARGHHVYAAYGADAGLLDDLPHLCRPPRADIEWALKGMFKNIEGASEQDAARYARDSGRSLAVIRRLIPAASGRREPAWAAPAVARELLPALLAGAWDERNTGDQAVLAALGDCDFKDLVAKLAPKISAIDSPLRKIGSAWKLASPRDAWFRLAPYLTQLDLDCFVTVAIEALGKNESDGAKLPRPSELLRSGISETIAVIATYPEKASAVPNAANVAHQIVRTLLDAAGGDRWLSVGPYFRTLAEASPEVFLACLEGSLKRPDRPVMALFKPLEARHSRLLWALETLAWNADFLPDVARCLATLARFDPPNSRYANRPSNSLREIFLLWLPQTAATLTQRLKIIDGLRKCEPEAAWNLMVGLIPGQDTATPSPAPRWRDYPTMNPEPTTYGLIARGANELLNRLLEDVGINSGRWRELINLLPKVEPERRKEIIKRLSDAAPKINDQQGQETILKTLRHLLRLHRDIADTDWALPEGELQQLEKIYESLQPGNSVERCLWLFQASYIELPKPMHSDYEGHQAAVEEARKVALEKIVAEQGEQGLWRLAENCGIPYFAGIAAAQGKIGGALIVSVVTEGLRSENEARQAFAGGILSQQLATKGEAPALALLDKARLESWPPAAITRIFLTMGNTRRVWDLLAEFGPEVDDLYWSQKHPLLAPKNETSDLEYMVRRMIRAKRAGPVLALVHQVQTKLTSGLIADTLEAATSEPDAADKTVGGHTMWEFYVQELLKHLDKVGGISEERMGRLELAYLPILRFASMRPEGRPPRVLHKRILNDPELFVRLICDIYPPDPESGIKEPAIQDETAASEKATQAYELLSSLSVVPGFDGSSLDGKKLEQWVAQVRRLCDEAGRLIVGDLKIGELLAKAPVAADGVWPAEPVREVIEISMSRRLDDGVQLGRRNLLGVTTRLYGDGGDQERDLARTYRQWSRATRLKWPRSSALLEKLAQSYDAEGHWHDDRAEEIDWND